MNLSFPLISAATPLILAMFEQICTGSSADRPAHEFKPSAEVYRESTGVYYFEETCTGTSPSYPADAFQLLTSICRAAEALPCGEDLYRSRRHLFSQRE